MLRDQKQDLIDKGHERAVARNKSLGLPIYVPTEEEKEQEKLDQKKKKAEAQKTLDDMTRKLQN